MIFGLESVWLTVQGPDGRPLDLLRGVNLTVESGETLALVGPSGSGKSTLLRLLNRLQDPSAGTIRLSGISLPEYDVLALRRRVGLVFQQPSMLPGTVADNLRFPFTLNPRNPLPSIEQLTAWMTDIGLDADLLGRDAAQLSGGEKQRIALARTLALAPEVLLLDEPTASLDPGSVQRIEERVLRWRKETSGTCIWVTHDLVQARRVADRVALLVAGQVLETGSTAAFLERPAHPLTGRFIHGEQTLCPGGAF